MKRKILITAATEEELHDINTSSFGDTFILEILLTGVGSVSTVYSLMSYLRNNNPPDYIINIGIAGSFNPLYAIGDTVLVESDCFADLGMEDHNEFISVWEAGIVHSSEFPFENGFIYSDKSVLDKIGGDIRKAKGLTINTASGSVATIDRLIARYDPDIETMEVAAALYVSRMENIPLLALRSVSNKVEPRNTDAWDTIKAISALKPALNIILEKLK